jgi:transposase-like protein
MAKEKCFFCKSNSTVKRGFRYNDSGKKQIYKCNKCKRKFTIENRRLRFKEVEIKKAISLYRKGMSLSEVQLEMKRKGLNVSRWMISLWNKKY